MRMPRGTQAVTHTETVTKMGGDKVGLIKRARRKPGHKTAKQKWSGI